MFKGYSRAAGKTVTQSNVQLGTPLLFCGTVSPPSLGFWEKGKILTQKGNAKKSITTNKLLPSTNLLGSSF